jgi:hypothetical protein
MIFRRLDPRQHGPARALGAGEVCSQQVGQPVAGILEQAGIVSRGDALPG